MVILLKLFVILSKKNLAIILAVIIIAFILMGEFLSAKDTQLDGSTNALRVEYLKGLKIEPDDSSVYSKNIIIPEAFDEVYKQYNSLQRKAGFDLSKYKGQEATVYTYGLSGEEGKEVHLIVKDGKIIGGDIASVKLNGEMIPLK